MIRVIGKVGCKNCDDVKLQLKKKGVEFTYELIMSLSKEEQDSLYDMADEKGISAMPLILRDEELITINDLL